MLLLMGEVKAIRKNPAATLMIYCSACGKDANEYNWTLETAAAFSEGEKTVPTLLSLLLEALEDPKKYADFQLVCPHCHEKVRLRQIPLPERETLLTYLREVGEEYLQERF
ncbi:MAG: hypothetical protein H6Q64_1375 [Firmicutes bacterium]|nr:hypothetical protein [Bacillota bacterium]